MRAVTIHPRQANSLRLDDIPDPAGEGAVRVRALAVGICGTDRELVTGEYGEAPPGRPRLVLGHESLGRVLTAPAASGFAPGDTVVGVVRHPDPVPCAIARAIGAAAPGGIVCLTGLCGGRRDASFDIAALNEAMVLENRVVFGTVNANLRHYRAAADMLAAAERSWLDALLTRKVPLERWREAYEKRPHDVKTVLVFDDAWD